MSAPALQGLKPWIYQRVTAIYIALYTFYLIYCLFTMTNPGYSAWYNWLSSVPQQIALVLFYFTILLHAWIGIRDVLLDYVKHFLLRLLLLFVVAMTLIGSGIWVIKIVLTIGLGTSHE